mgnify:CR=1 FL=1
MSESSARAGTTAAGADASAGLVDQVRRLLSAENQADATAAEALLAPGFVRITRASGREEDRAALLAAIASPARPGLWRHLVESETRAWIHGGLGVVSSVVQTRPPVAGEPSGRFRNLHVFERDGGAWRCVAWQVTRLE